MALRRAAAAMARAATSAAGRDGAAAFSLQPGQTAAGVQPQLLLRSLLAARWGGPRGQGFAAAAAPAAEHAAGLPPPPPLQQQQQQQQHRSAHSTAQASAPAATAAAAAPEAAAAAAAAAAEAVPAEVPEVYTPLAERVSERFSVAPQPVFAVVEVGGTQYKVTPNDVIITEKLGGVDVSQKLLLGRVLLLGSREETVIGRPYIPGAHVTAVVEEQFLDGKVLIFHKRRRKNSRRLKGHRQPLTTLRILGVEGPLEALQGEEESAAQHAA